MSPVAQKSSPGPGKPTFTGAGTGTEITGIHRDWDPGTSLILGPSRPVNRLRAEEDSPFGPNYFA